MEGVDISISVPNTKMYTYSYLRNYIFTQISVYAWSVDVGIDSSHKDRPKLLKQLDSK